MSAALSPIIGRYVDVAFDGTTYKVHFEEAGQGIPLLCLHTSGADGRQYHSLMEDQAITARFRVIAFDLPWHGRTDPPPGWQDQEYKLTSRFYGGFVLAFQRALGLERPALMGCSIGGRVVLKLAAENARDYRAIIGLESSPFVQAYYDTAWLHHPEVDASELNAAMTYGHMAPQSPDEHKWRSLWIYMQGAPGVTKGNMHFYMSDGDLRETVRGIDPATTPLYLLTGEYDYSCSPADTEALGREVPGAKVTIMKGIGHLPMCENPELFLTFIRPVLDEVAARA